MTATALLYIVMGVGAGFCLAGGVGAFVLGRTSKGEPGNGTAESDTVAPQASKTRNGSARDGDAAPTAKDGNDAFVGAQTRRAKRVGVVFHDTAAYEAQGRQRQYMEQRSSDPAEMTLGESAERYSERTGHYGLVAARLKADDEKTQRAKHHGRFAAVRKRA